jgi:5'-nucleotidase
MDRPVILISNDDGVRAEGIIALATALAPLGEIIVVAPSTDQSAVSHSMSLRRPLRVERLDDLKTDHGSVAFYAVDGTPTDSVYMAAHHILKGRKIDLVASGINHGANLGSDVLYSGTVSAAMEGVFLGIQAVAFSLVANHREDFSGASQFANALCKTLLGRPLPKGTLLNVNVPKTIGKSGYCVTSIGHHEYTNVVQERKDPRGHAYYWIGGEWNGFKDLPGTDCKAIAEGRISVTPVEVKLTNEKLMPWVRDLPIDGYAATR